jgi:YVTN family beta-propeller protein
MPAPPSGLTLSADDSTLYVTCASPESKICVVDTARKKITSTLPAGHTARSPVLSPDGRTLYVCNQFNNDISVIDLATRREVRRIPVQREPMAADLTPDGKYLLVANHLSNTASDQQFVEAVVSVIDVAANRVVKELPLPAGSEMVKDIKISSNGRYAVVSHIFCNYDLPTTRVELGLINANALTIIDLSNIEVLSTILLDEPKHGAANPWGLAWSADSSILAVAHAGTHEVSIIDFPRMLAGLPKTPRAAYPNSTSTSVLKFVPHYEDDELNNGLPYLVGARERVRLPAGDFVPRAIAIHGRTVYTANYMSDDLSEIDLGSWPNQTTPLRATSHPLGPRKKMSEARKGELYFHDGTLCYQGWQSCSSCHPGDGRVDALNWDLASDGLGNPRNTRSILFDHKIGTLAGNKMSLQDQMNGGAPAAVAVRVAIKSLLFTNQPEEVVAAMDEYLKSLRPVPSPYLIHGRLSPAAARGKSIFIRANCSNCHIPGLFADGRPHSVGTATPGDGANPRFYTPSLIEAWRTAPYLHTGSAATIRDVLTTCNPRDGRHGGVADLSPQELDDLCAYVLSL